MNSHKPFKTFIAAFTVFTFFVTSLGISPNAFASAAMPEVSLPYQLAIDRNLGFSIPQKLGKLEQFSAGQGGRPVVFHVQTAHGHYQAQQQIRQILHFLDKHYGVRTVLVEGSAFQLDPELLNFFPQDKELTQKVNDALTKQAIVKGPELYLLEAKGAKAFGIEDLPAYRENGVSFVSVLEEQQKTGQFLADMNMQIERLSSHFLNKDLRDFLQRVENFEKNRIPLDTWLAGLKKEARTRLEIDLVSPAHQLDWPMMVRLFKIQELSQKLDRNAFFKERDAFLKAIRRFLPRKGKQATGNDPLNVPRSTFAAIESLLRNDSMSQQLPDPETSLLFEDMVRRLPENFNYDAFPNVCYFIGALLLQSELKADRLMLEVRKLTDTISEKLTRNPEEKKLVALLEDHRLLQKLFALELTPADYEAILRGRETDRKPSFLISKMQNAARSAGGVARAKDIRFSHIADLDALFAKAMKFYKGVKERDTLMMKRVEERLKETGAGRAAVITGGFHAQPFQDYFSGKNYTYALISPTLSGADEAGYQAYIQNMLRSSERVTNGAKNSTRRDSSSSVKPGVLSTKKATRETVFPSDRQVLAPKNLYGLDQSVVREMVRGVIRSVAGGAMPVRSEMREEDGFWAKSHRPVEQFQLRTLKPGPIKSSLGWTIARGILWIAGIGAAAAIVYWVLKTGIEREDEREQIKQEMIDGSHQPDTQNRSETRPEVISERIVLGIKILGREETSIGGGTATMAVWKIKVEDPHRGFTELLRTAGFDDLQIRKILALLRQKTFSVEYLEATASGVSYNPMIRMGILGAAQTQFTVEFVSSPEKKTIFNLAAANRAKRISVERQKGIVFENHQIIVFPERTKNAPMNDAELRLRISEQVDAVLRQIKLFYMAQMMGQSEAAQVSDEAVDESRARLREMFEKWVDLSQRSLTDEIDMDLSMVDREAAAMILSPSDRAGAVRAGHIVQVGFPIPLEEAVIAQANPTVYKIKQAIATLKLAPRSETRTARQIVKVTARSIALMAAAPMALLFSYMTAGFGLAAIFSPLIELLSPENLKVSILDVPLENGWAKVGMTIGLLGPLSFATWFPAKFFVRTTIALFQQIKFGFMKDSRADLPLKWHKALRNVKLSLLDRMIPNRGEKRRAQAAKILGDLKDPRAVTALDLALSDRSEKVRKAATAALAKIQTPRSEMRSSKTVHSEVFRGLVAVGLTLAVSGLVGCGTLSDGRSFSSSQPQAPPSNLSIPNGAPKQSDAEVLRDRATKLYVELRNEKLSDDFDWGISKRRVKRQADELGKIGNHGVLSLVWLIDDSSVDKTVREIALETLKGIGDPGRQYFRSFLTSKSIGEVRRGLHGLHLMGAFLETAEERAVDAIAAYRWDEVSRMGQAGVDRVIGFMDISNLTTQDSATWDFRIQAAEGLGRIKNPTAIAPLIQLLRYEEGSVLVSPRGVPNLGMNAPNIPDSRYWGDFSSRVPDNNAKLIAAVEEALLRFGNIAVKPLNDAMFSRNPNIRRHAIEVLGKLSNPVRSETRAGISNFAWKGAAILGWVVAAGLGVWLVNFPKEAAKPQVIRSLPVVSNAVTRTIQKPEPRNAKTSAVTAPVPVSGKQPTIITSNVVANTSPQSQQKVSVSMPRSNQVPPVVPGASATVGKPSAARSPQKIVSNASPVAAKAGESQKLSDQEFKALRDRVRAPYAYHSSTLDVYENGKSFKVNRASYEAAQLLKIKDPRLPEILLEAIREGKGNADIISEALVQMRDVRFIDAAISFLRSNTRVQGDWWDAHIRYKRDVASSLKAFWPQSRKALPELLKMLREGEAGATWLIGKDEIDRETIESLRQTAKNARFKEDLFQQIPPDVFKRQLGKISDPQTRDLLWIMYLTRQPDRGEFSRASAEELVSSGHIVSDVVSVFEKPEVVSALLLLEEMDPDKLVQDIAVVTTANTFALTLWSSERVQAATSDVRLWALANRSTVVKLLAYGRKITIDQKISRSAGDEGPLSFVLPPVIWTQQDIPALKRLSNSQYPFYRQTAQDVLSRSDVSVWPNQSLDRNVKLGKLMLEHIDSLVRQKKFGEMASMYWEQLPGETIRTYFHQMGDKAYLILIPMIDSPDFSTRRIGIEILSSLPKDPRLFDLYVSKLSDENSFVRDGAVEALGKQGDPRAIPYLMELFSGDSSMYEAGAALKKLGATKKQMADAYMKALSSSSSYRRADAVYELGELGDARAIQPLRLRLKDEDSSVRQAAEQALKKLGMNEKAEPKRSETRSPEDEDGSFIPREELPPGYDDGTNLGRNPENVGLDDLSAATMEGPESTELPLDVLMKKHPLRRSEMRDWSAVLQNAALWLHGLWILKPFVEFNPELSLKLTQWVSDEMGTFRRNADDGSYQKLRGIYLLTKYYLKANLASVDYKRLEQAILTVATNLIPTDREIRNSVPVEKTLLKPFSQTDLFFDVPARLSSEDHASMRRMLADTLKHQIKETFRKPLGEESDVDLPSAEQVFHTLKPLYQITSWDFRSFLGDQYPGVLQTLYLVAADLQNYLSIDLSSMRVLNLKGERPQNKPALVEKQLERFFSLPVVVARSESRTPAEAYQARLKVLDRLADMRAFSPIFGYAAVAIYNLFHPNAPLSIKTVATNARAHADMRNWVTKRYGKEVVMGNMDIYLLIQAILEANGKAQGKPEAANVEIQFNDELSLAPSVLMTLDMAGINMDKLVPAKDVLDFGRIKQLAEFFRIMETEHPGEPRIAKVIAPASLVTMMMDGGEIAMGIQFPDEPEGQKLKKVMKYAEEVVAAVSEYLVLEGHVDGIVYLEPTATGLVAKQFIRKLDDYEEFGVAPIRRLLGKLHDLGALAGYHPCCPGHDDKLNKQIMERFTKIPGLDILSIDNVYNLDEIYDYLEKIFAGEPRRPILIGNLNTGEGSELAENDEVAVRAAVEKLFQRMGNRRFIVATSCDLNFGKNWKEMGRETYVRQLDANVRAFSERSQELAQPFRTAARSEARTPQEKRESIVTFMGAFEDLFQQAELKQRYEQDGSISLSGRTFRDVGMFPNHLRNYRRLQSGSSDIQSTDGAFDCAVIFSKWATASAFEWQMYHYYLNRSGEDDRDRMRKDNVNDMDTIISSGGNIVVVFYDEQETIYEEVVKVFSDSFSAHGSPTKILMVKTPGGSSKNGIAMEEGIGIHVGPTMLALTWEELESLAGDRTLTVLTLDQLAEARAGASRSEVRTATDSGIRLPQLPSQKHPTLEIAGMAGFLALIAVTFFAAILPGENKTREKNFVPDSTTNALVQPSGLRSETRSSKAEYQAARQAQYSPAKTERARARQLAEAATASGRRQLWQREGILVKPGVRRSELRERFETVLGAIGGGALVTGVFAYRHGSDVFQLEAANFATYLMIFAAIWAGSQAVRVVRFLFSSEADRPDSRFMPSDDGSSRSELRGSANIIPEGAEAFLKDTGVPGLLRVVRPGSSDELSLKALALDMDDTFSISSRGWMARMKEFLAERMLLNSQNTREKVFPVVSAYVDLYGGPNNDFDHVTWMMNPGQLPRGAKEIIPGSDGIFGAPRKNAEVYVQEWVDSLEKYRAEQLGALGRNGVLIPGAEAFLNAAHDRGLRLVANSGYADVGVKAEIKRLRLERLFAAEDRHGATQAYPSKAAVIQHFLVQQDGLLPGQIAMIGDSMGDVRNGLEAGAYGILFTEGNTEKLLSIGRIPDSQRPHFVITDYNLAPVDLVRFLAGTARSELRKTEIIPEKFRLLNPDIRELPFSEGNEIQGHKVYPRLVPASAAAAQVNELKALRLLLDPRKGARAILVEGYDQMTYLSVFFIVVLELLTLSRDVKQKKFSFGLATGGTTESTRKFLGLLEKIKEVYGEEYLLKILHALGAEDIKTLDWQKIVENIEAALTLDGYYFGEEFAEGANNQVAQVSAYRNEQLYMMLMNFFGIRWNTEAERAKVVEKIFAGKFISPPLFQKTMALAEQLFLKMLQWFDEKTAPVAPLLWKINGGGTDGHEGFDESARVPPDTSKPVVTDIVGLLTAGKGNEDIAAIINSLKILDHAEPLFRPDGKVELYDITRVQNAFHFIPKPWHPFFLRFMGDKKTWNLLDTFEVMKRMSVEEILTYYKDVKSPKNPNEPEWQFQNQEQFLEAFRYLLRNFQKTPAYGITQKTGGLVDRLEGAFNFLMINGRHKHRTFSDIWNSFPTNKTTGSFFHTLGTTVIVTEDAFYGTSPDAIPQDESLVFKFTPDNKKAAEQVTRGNIDVWWGETAEGQRFRVLHKTPTALKLGEKWPVLPGLEVKVKSMDMGGSGVGIELKSNGLFATATATRVNTGDSTPQAIGEYLFLDSVKTGDSIRITLEPNGESHNRTTYSLTYQGTDSRGAYVFVPAMEVAPVARSEARAKAGLDMATMEMVQLKDGYSLPRIIRFKPFPGEQVGLRLELDTSSIQMLQGKMMTEVTSLRYAVVIQPMRPAIVTVALTHKDERSKADLARVAAAPTIRIQSADATEFVHNYKRLLEQWLAAQGYWPFNAPQANLNDALAVSRDAASARPGWTAVEPMEFLDANHRIQLGGFGLVTVENLGLDMRGEKFGDVHVQWAMEDEGTVPRVVMFENDALAPVMRDSLGRAVRAVPVNGASAAFTVFSPTLKEVLVEVREVLPGKDRNDPPRVRVEIVPPPDVAVQWYARSEARTEVGRIHERDSERLAAIKTMHTKKFGKAPAVVTLGPGRGNIEGEHVDYPDYELAMLATLVNVLRYRHDVPDRVWRAVTGVDPYDIIKVKKMTGARLAKVSAQIDAIRKVLESSEYLQKIVGQKSFKALLPENFSLPFSSHYNILVAGTKTKSGAIRVYSMDYQDYFEFSLSELADLIRKNPDPEVDPKTKEMKDPDYLAYLQKNGLDFGGKHRWAAYWVGLYWEALKRGGMITVKDGADFTVQGNIPKGSGMSSSAGLEVAMTGMAEELFGWKFATDDAKAKMARTGEVNPFVRSGCGLLDQMGSMKGKEGQAFKVSYKNLNKVEYTPLAMGPYQFVMVNTRGERELAQTDYDTRAAFELPEAPEIMNDLLGYKGKRLKFHVSSFTWEEFKSIEARFLARNETVARRTRHVIGEKMRTQKMHALFGEAQELYAAKQNDKALLKLIEIGRLLNESGNSMMMDGDFAISGKVAARRADGAMTEPLPLLDMLVRLGREENAGVRDLLPIFARMMGGGGGGVAIFMVPTGQFEGWKERLKKDYLGQTGIQLTDEDFIPGIPSEGARTVARSEDRASDEELVRRVAEDLISNVTDDRGFLSGALRGAHDLLSLGQNYFDVEQQIRQTLAAAFLDKTETEAFFAEHHAAIESALAARSEMRESFPGAPRGKHPLVGLAAMAGFLALVMGTLVAALIPERDKAQNKPSVVVPAANAPVPTDFGRRSEARSVKAAPKATEKTAVKEHPVQAGDRINLHETPGGKVFAHLKVGKFETRPSLEASVDLDVVAFKDKKISSVQIKEGRKLTSLKPETSELAIVPGNEIIVKRAGVTFRLKLIRIEQSTAVFEMTPENRMEIKGSARSEARTKTMAERRKSFVDELARVKLGEAGYVLVQDTPDSMGLHLTIRRDPSAPKDQLTVASQMLSYQFRQQFPGQQLYINMQRAERKPALLRSPGTAAAVRSEARDVTAEAVDAFLGQLKTALEPVGGKFFPATDQMLGAVSLDDKAPDHQEFVGFIQHLDHSIEYLNKPGGSSFTMGLAESKIEVLGETGRESITTYHGAFPTLAILQKIADGRLRFVLAGGTIGTDGRYDDLKLGKFLPPEVLVENDKMSDAERPYAVLARLIAKQSAELPAAAKPSAPKFTGVVRIPSSVKLVPGPVAEAPAQPVAAVAPGTVAPTSGSSLKLAKPEGRLVVTTSEGSTVMTPTQLADHLSQKAVVPEPAAKPTLLKLAKDAQVVPAGQKRYPGAPDLAEEGTPVPEKPRSLWRRLTGRSESRVIVETVNTFADLLAEKVTDAIQQAKRVENAQEQGDRVAVSFDGNVNGAEFWGFVQSAETSEMVFYSGGPSLFQFGLERSALQYKDEAGQFQTAQEFNGSFPLRAVVLDKQAENGIRLVVEGDAFVGNEWLDGFGFGRIIPAGELKADQAQSETERRYSVLAEYKKLSLPPLTARQPIRIAGVNFPAKPVRSESRVEAVIDEGILRALKSADPADVTWAAEYLVKNLDPTLKEVLARGHLLRSQTDFHSFDQERVINEYGQLMSDLTEILAALTGLLKNTPQNVVRASAGAAPAAGSVPAVSENIWPAFQQTEAVWEKLADQYLGLIDHAIKGKDALWLSRTATKTVSSWAYGLHDALVILVAMEKDEKTNALSSEIETILGRIKTFFVSVDQAFQPAKSVLGSQPRLLGDIEATGRAIQKQILEPLEHFTTQVQAVSEHQIHLGVRTSFGRQVPTLYVYHPQNSIDLVKMDLGSVSAARSPSAEVIKQELDWWVTQGVLGGVEFHVEENSPASFRFSAGDLRTRLVISSLKSGRKDYAVAEALKALKKDIAALVSGPESSLVQVLNEILAGDNEAAKSALLATTQTLVIKNLINDQSAPERIEFPGSKEPLDAKAVDENGRKLVTVLNRFSQPRSKALASKLTPVDAGKWSIHEADSRFFGQKPAEGTELKEDSVLLKTTEGDEVRFAPDLTAIIPSPAVTGATPFQGKAIPVLALAYPTVDAEKPLVVIYDDAGYKLPFELEKQTGAPILWSPKGEGFLKFVPFSVYGTPAEKAKYTEIASLMVPFHKLQAGASSAGVPKAAVQPKTTLTIDNEDLPTVDQFLAGQLSAEGVLKGARITKVTLNGPLYDGNSQEVDATDMTIDFGAAGFQPGSIFNLSDFMLRKGAKVEVLYTPSTARSELRAIPALSKTMKLMPMEELVASEVLRRSWKRLPGDTRRHILEEYSRLEGRYRFVIRRTLNTPYKWGIEVQEPKTHKKIAELFLQTDQQHPNLELVDYRAKATLKEPVKGHVATEPALALNIVSKGTRGWPRIQVIFPDSVAKKFEGKVPEGLPIQIIPESEAIRRSETRAAGDVASMIRELYQQEPWLARVTQKLRFGVMALRIMDALKQAGALGQRMIERVSGISLANPAETASARQAVTLASRPETLNPKSVEAARAVFGETKNRTSDAFIFDATFAFDRFAIAALRPVFGDIPMIVMVRNDTEEHRVGDRAKLARVNSELTKAGRPEILQADNLDGVKAFMAVEKGRQVGIGRELRFKAIVDTSDSMAIALKEMIPDFLPVNDENFKSFMFQAGEAVRVLVASIRAQFATRKSA